MIREIALHCSRGPRRPIYPCASPESSRQIGGLFAFSYSESATTNGVIEPTYPTPPRPKSETLVCAADLRGCFCNISRMSFRPTKLLFFEYGTKTKSKLERIQRTYSGRFLTLNMAAGEAGEVAICSTSNLSFKPANCIRPPFAIKKWHENPKDA